MFYHQNSESQLPILRYAFITEGRKVTVLFSNSVILYEFSWKSVIWFTIWNGGHIYRHINLILSFQERKACSKRNTEQNRIGFDNGIEIGNGNIRREIKMWEINREERKDEEVTNHNIRSRTIQNYSRRYENEARLALFFSVTMICLVLSGTLWPRSLHLLCCPSSAICIIKVYCSRNFTLPSLKTDTPFT